MDKTDLPSGRATTGTEEKAEDPMRIPLTYLTGKLLRGYETSGGERGYVRAQVNPAKAPFISTS